MYDKLIYHGNSMFPTFKNGDDLYVIPYGRHRICRGDVVVFYNPQNNDKVVHRVAAVMGQDIRTKGDNNSKTDFYTLSSGSIIGRVVYAQRNKRRFYVYGGFAGRLYAAAQGLVKKIDLSVSFILSPLYQVLAKAGVTQRLIPSFLKPKIVRFKKKIGDELQLMIGRFSVGRYFKNKGEWRIKRPFRFFVDKELQ